MRETEASVLCRRNWSNCRGCCSPASLLPPLLYWLWYLSDSVLSYFSLQTQQEVVKLFAFFFFLPGYFSASWAHWNQLGAGSDKHWNQHKKGQKCVDCRKNVIGFISLGCWDFSAWNNSMVMNEYGEIYLHDFDV